MEKTASINTDRSEHGVVLDLLDFCKGLAILWVMLVHGLHRWFGWLCRPTGWWRSSAFCS